MYSDDLNDTDYMLALQFVGNNGDSITCGTLNGSPSTATPAGQTDPIPVFFDWDFYEGYVESMELNTVDYNGLDAA